MGQPPLMQVLRYLHKWGGSGGGPAPTVLYTIWVDVAAPSPFCEFVCSRSHRGVLGVLGFPRGVLDMGQPPFMQVLRYVDT